MTNPDYQRQARAGIRLLVKRLEKLSEDATKIGHSSVAATTARDKDSLQSTLDAERPWPKPEDAGAHDRTVLHTGLALLAHNLKAAAGTVTALGRYDLADEFQAEATDIETHVLPLLEEQTALRLEKAASS